MCSASRDMSGRKLDDNLSLLHSLRKNNDILCKEHGLSVIPENKPGEWQKRTTYPKKETKRDDIRNLIDLIFEKKRPDSIDEFVRALEDNGYEVKRGKYISVKGKEQKNFLRLRSLGNGYTEKDIEKRMDNSNSSR